MRAAKKYGKTPSELLRMRNESLAIAFDLAMALVSERETQRNIKDIERQAGRKKGTVFPVLDLAALSED